MGVAADLGLVIGVLLGLLGAGGSILAVPALVYGVGQPLSAAGIPAAFAGTAANRQLDPRVVLLGFAVVMAAAALRMLREQPEVGGDCALPGGGVNWRGCLPKAIATGAVVGLLTGLLGVGGGFLLVPALVLLLGLPMTVAVGTSLLIVTLNATAGFAAHAGTADIDYAVAGGFTAAAVAGSLLAARFATRLPAAALRRGFAWLVLAVAGAVAVQGLVNPAAGT